MYKSLRFGICLTLLAAAFVLASVLMQPVDSAAEEAAGSAAGSLYGETSITIQEDGENPVDALTLMLADSTELTYRVDASISVSDYTVSWSSSDESIVSAETDQDGNVTVTAKKSGSAVLTLLLTPASPDGEVLMADCEVTVPYQDGFYQSDSGEWYYAANGEAVASDIVKDGDGKVDGTKNRWWYVENGRVGCGYTGYAENKNGWWYVENGYVPFTKNSVVKDVSGVIGTAGTYWYVVGSEVQTSFTGLADYPNQNGWWYIEDGQVTFTKNTVAKNKNGWYYVVDSKVQFDFTGLANYPNQNGWFYITKGHVDFSKNTVAKNKNGWYYVTGGKVQFGFTGLADYCNANGWWYIDGGHVDFSYNGIAENKNGRWYLEDGKVDFTYSGYWTEDGLTYTLKNGKVLSAGSFIWPLPGNTTITSSYGYRICPYHGYEFHGGIDIAASKGTSILACADGTVTAVGYSSSRGNYIEINHGNGITTTYWHCNSVAVKKGQTVKLGQVIGTVGMTGNATGYHLDLRFLVNGSYVSPLTYVTPV